MIYVIKNHGELVCLLLSAPIPAQKLPLLNAFIRFSTEGAFGSNSSMS
jgi:hypothetical protein